MDFSQLSVHLALGVESAVSRADQEVQPLIEGTGGSTWTLQSARQDPKVEQEEQQKVEQQGIELKGEKISRITHVLQHFKLATVNIALVLSVLAVLTLVLAQVPMYGGPWLSRERGVYLQPFPRMPIVFYALSTVATNTVFIFQLLFWVNHSGLAAVRARFPYEVARHVLAVLLCQGGLCAAFFYLWDNFRSDCHQPYRDVNAVLNVASLSLPLALRTVLVSRILPNHRWVFIRVWLGYYLVSFIAVAAPVNLLPRFYALAQSDRLFFASVLGPLALKIPRWLAQPVITSQNDIPGATSLLLVLPVIIICSVYSAALKMNMLSYREAALAILFDSVFRLLNRQSYLWRKQRSADAHSFCWRQWSWYRRIAQKEPKNEIQLNVIGFMRRQSRSLMTHMLTSYLSPLLALVATLLLRENFLAFNGPHSTTGRLDYAVLTVSSLGLLGARLLVDLFSLQVGSLRRLPLKDTLRKDFTNDPILLLLRPSLLAAVLVTLFSVTCNFVLLLYNRDYGFSDMCQAQEFGCFPFPCRLCAFSPSSFNFSNSPRHPPLLNQFLLLACNEWSQGRSENFAIENSLVIVD